jgi:Tol biopolymer transport system component
MRGIALAGILVAGCSQPAGPDPGAPRSEETVLKIATTERGPRGGRLVAIDEQGVRRADLTKSGTSVVIDINPAWSPDGEYIVFASNRDRGGVEATSLWIVRAAVGQEPRRLTRTGSVEREPRWLPSSREIVYVSDAGGSLDLYRLALKPSGDGLLEPAAAPVRLTDDRGDERSPTVASDGRSVAFMAIDRKTQRARLRRLDLRSGAQRDLTRGPFDATPAFDPEGGRLAFARPGKEHEEVMAIYLLDLESGEIEALPAEELADLTGPVWSIDGRHLLATATLRSVKDASAILSSLVVIDLWAKDRVWRALHDPAFVETRIGATLAPRSLRPSLVDLNHPYKTALRHAVERHLIERQEDRQREPR